jgi:MFS transporter, SP family, arabinose:H+ symporter
MTHMLNSTLLRTVLAAALAGLLLGFDTAVIAGATRSLTSSFELSPAALGLTVSAALWGTVAGAIGAGALGRRFGGRASLFILATCYLISALGCAFSPSWASLLLFRFIGGLGMGGSSVIAPVYIAEIAPFAWRGRLVGTFQINVIGGILLAYFSNYLIGLTSPGVLEWRWQLGMAAAPAGLLLLMLLGIPPSARWLATRGRLKEASLAESAGPKADRLFQWRYRRPILLALALAMFNQLVGVNAVLYYLNDIFAMAGFDRASQHVQAVTVGTVMLAATLLALALIDRVGRRMLLLAGSVGLAICLAGIAAIFHLREYERALLALLVGYVAFFAFSQGAVIWVYVSEIFPDRVRAQGQSLGSSTHWVMNAVISGVFPLLSAQSQAGPFVMFLVMVVLQFFAVLLFFPETRGVRLEDMQQRMGMAGDAERYCPDIAPASRGADQAASRRYDLSVD